MITYLLDTNVFIQAKNQHYGFDFCPAFWQWLIEQNEAGRVASTEKVGDELYAGDDELSIWARDRGEGLFLKPQATISSALTKVSSWASNSGCDPAAVSAFLQIADYWLVAHALALDCTVVTHEKPADTNRKIKIPNACNGVGLSYVNPYEMLRREQARFVLGPDRSSRKL